MQALQTLYRLSGLDTSNQDARVPVAGDVPDEVADKTTVGSSTTTLRPAADVTQPPDPAELARLPLPIVAAHHPSTLTKLRAPLPTPADAASTTSAATPARDKKPTPPAPLRAALAAEAKTHGRLRAALVLARDDGAALHARVGSARLAAAGAEAAARAKRALLARDAAGARAQLARKEAAAAAAAASKLPLMRRPAASALAVSTSTRAVSQPNAVAGVSDNQASPSEDRPAPADSFEHAQSSDRDAVSSLARPATPVQARSEATVQQVPYMHFLFCSELTQE
jgi:hypothetical protein